MKLKIDTLIAKFKEQSTLANEIKKIKWYPVEIIWNKSEEPCVVISRMHGSAGERLERD